MNKFMEETLYTRTNGSLLIPINPTLNLTLLLYVNLITLYLICSGNPMDAEPNGTNIPKRLPRMEREM